MAKIFYFVSGEGLGHATRSVPIISHLSKNHTITPFSSNRAYKILKNKFQNTKKVKDFELIYKNNKLDLKSSFIENFRNLKKILRHLKGIRKLIKNQKPDLMISDFSIYPRFLSLMTGVNYITIDNNHSVAKFKVKKYQFWEWLKTWIYTKIFVSNHKLNIIPAFYSLKTKYKTLLINPIIRPEIIKLRKDLDSGKLKEKDHILVYQTSTSYPNLISQLKKIDEKFIIYGLDRMDKRKERRLNRAQHSKLIFKSFNESEFFKDLASSKAVISNGGFTLLSEAIYLNKAVMSVPIRKQYEQVLNAVLVNKKRIGLYSKKINKKRFEKLIETKEIIKSNQEKYNNYDPNTSLKIIEKVISDITK